MNWSEHYSLYQQVAASFALTLSTTLVALLLIGPLACLLAFLHCFFPRRSTHLIVNLATIPQALPPVALGFLLFEAILFTGADWLLFSRAGVTLVAAVVSFPIIFFAAKDAFATIPKAMIDASQALALSWPTLATNIALPLARSGITTGFILAFSRCMGEFGATIIIAGSIPGKTDTLAINLYQTLLSGNLKAAKLYGICCIFLALLCQHLAKKRNIP